MRPTRSAGVTAALVVAAVLVVAAALALVAVPAGAGSRATRTRARPGVALRSSSSAPPQAPAGGTPPLYRIVGCASHGRAAYTHGPFRREVAIGFDDGPAPDTSAFVRMLERSHAHATFFMIGDQTSAIYRRMLLRELADGDVLGDHTFTHPYLTNVRDVRAQLSRTIAVIRSLTGYTPCVFRPPYGVYDQSIIDTARALGLATVMWNVAPSDYTLPGVAAIEQRVLAHVVPGSIIISHDGGGARAETLAAYPGIIAALRARGYRIVTIPQLLGFRPVYAPCGKLCDGLGVARSALPRNAIIERPRP